MNKRTWAAAFAVAVSAAGLAETPLAYEAELFGNAGSGDFAPYYMMSNNGGVLTQPKTVGVRAKVRKELDLSKRFSYSFGADVVAGYASATDYRRFLPGESEGEGQLVMQGRRPSSAWLQQLYAEVKYRGVFLSAGMKERTSPLLNPELGSGDFIESNNSRPIPQVRIGFVDFQDIPFTNGWVQIQGEIAYGMYTHDSWLEDHYDHYNSFITTDVWSHYKRAYFRTKPSQPFSVTVGMQTAGQFGGRTRDYKNGKMTGDSKADVSLKDFWDMLLPTGNLGPADVYEDGEARYYYGNTLGSWDFVARYRLPDETELKAYFQWPFEDGSGIGKLNGFDGIWGLEYKSRNENSIVSDAVLEYIDFTNQSGPTHWAPNDTPGTPIRDEATGADSYYNNYGFNSYMHHGMSIGTPFIPSVVYNRDGYMRVKDNRIRGFHAGISGRIFKPLKYRLLVSYRRSWGSYAVPRLEIADNTSVMLEGVYDFRQLEGLRLKGQVAFDKGSLLGDNFGVMLSLSYSGFADLFGK